VPIEAEIGAETTESHKVKDDQEGWQVVTPRKTKTKK
jgi:hypothetical protein